MEKRERSSRIKSLVDALKINTDRKMYLQLVELLEHLQYDTLESMVHTTDKDELLRQQGQARGLTNLRSQLTRSPVSRDRLTGDLQ